MSVRDLIPYAAASGTLGFMPVPLLDDYSASMVRGLMLRRIADRHAVQLEPRAMRILSRDSKATPGFPRRETLKTLAIIFRRMVMFMGAATAADEALQTFVLGHLFDRYLSERHPPDADVVTEEQARLLQKAMDEGARAAADSALKDLFMQAVLAGVDTVGNIPEVLARALRTVQGWPEDSIDDEDTITAPLFSEISDVIATCRDCYFKDVDRAFDRTFGRGSRPARKSTRKRRRAEPGVEAHESERLDEYIEQHVRNGATGRRHRAAMTEH